MVNHEQIQAALQTQLKTLSVVTTGAISLSATGTTYVRTTGSFLDDGFYAGMEVLGSGFDEAGNNVSSNILGVAALTLTVNRTLTTEGAGAGKTLAVGLPSRRAWEGIEFDPDTGEAYVLEQYLPAPAALRTTKNLGTVEVTPTWVIEVHVPEGYGTGAMNGYCDKILESFYPEFTMALTNGDTLRVRGDPAPWRGQLLRRKAGWVTVPVTIPLRLFTTNP